MVDRNLIRKFKVEDDELDTALGGALASLEQEELDAVYDQRAQAGRDDSCAPPR